MSGGLRAMHARQNLLMAALRVIRSSMDIEQRADSAAEAEYADEQLALAARELAEATDALAPEWQPVGWNRGEDR